MAEHDYVIDNADGATVRADINNVLQAIASNNSKATDLTTNFAFQFYMDTGDNILKIRNAGNNAYINLLGLGANSTTNVVTDVNQTFTKAQKELIINTLKQNDDYTRNFSHHKTECINILFAEWHRLFPANKQDVNCTSCRNAVIKFFKTMHIEWDTEIEKPKKKTRAKKSKK